MTANPRYYITTTIPYVNARPHLGFALELVQADVLARHRRHRSDQVRFLSGTDENSLKNVLAAEAEGIAVRELVDRNAAAFSALRGPLALSLDDFIRTGSDPRHRVGVERLWRRCAEAGDLYRKHYEGLYCVGCEQFYAPEDLVDGRCTEHGTEPQRIAEENWFFRLSRYTDELRGLIEYDRLRIQPASRRNEVLALISGGLHDFSVSRSAARARGWGIAVPDDPSQVVYVWWEALGNYVSSLGYGGGDETEYERWWVGGRRRVHLAGKGVLRFHAVYWPALLLSAGLPLPTDILVHDYLTVDGHKISKSAGATVDPVRLAAECGTDAVRWWLIREVPRVGDADFTRDRLVARADADLAGGLGNLVHRVVTLVHRCHGGRVSEPGDIGPGRVEAAVRPLTDACDSAPAQIDAALEDFDFRGAASALWTIVEQANRSIAATRPWELAKAARAGDPEKERHLDAVLSTLIHACRVLADELTPFLPGAAARIARQCTAVGGVLAAAEPLFPRIGPNR
jgi:methionyl-tRNA synthetase